MQEVENGKKPKGLLKVLIMLSFIGGSFNMIGGLQDAFSKPSNETVESFNEIFEKIKIESPESEYMIDQMDNYVAALNAQIVNSGATNFMLNAISLIGVFLMYRMQKTGFFIYVSAQVLLLFLPMLFGGNTAFTQSITLFYAFFTGFFIMLYAGQLRLLK